MTFSCIHNCQEFLPADLTYNLDFIGTTLCITRFSINHSQCKNLCNLIFRVETVIIETVRCFCTEVKTSVTTLWRYIFLKCFTYKLFSYIFAVYYFFLNSMVQYNILYKCRIYHNDPCLNISHNHRQRFIVYNVLRLRHNFLLVQFWQVGHIGILDVFLLFLVMYSWTE